MLKRKLYAALLAVAIVGAACQNQSCAHLKAPEQLTPIGDVAWNARTAIRLVDELQRTAIEGEKAGAIRTEDAKKIVEATVLAGEAGVTLSRSLAAGAAETGARAQAVAAFKQALADLPAKLSPNTQKVVAPYVTAILTLLTVFE